MGFEPTYDGFAIRHAIAQIVDSKTLWQQLPGCLQSCLQLLAAHPELSEAVGRWSALSHAGRRAVLALVHALHKR